MYGIGNNNGYPYSGMENSDCKGMGRIYGVLVMSISSSGC